MTFIESNIISTFITIGIFSYNTKIILSKITKSTTLLNEYDLVFTLKTSLFNYAIHKVTCMFQK